jgi:hypothetical protein
VRSRAHSQLLRALLSYESGIAFMFTENYGIRFLRRSIHWDDRTTLLDIASSLIRALQNPTDGVRKSG